jgi:hypothetical protein
VWIGGCGERFISRRDMLSKMLTLVLNLEYHCCSAALFLFVGHRPDEGAQWVEGSAKVHVVPNGNSAGVIGRGYVNKGVRPYQ